jgi:cytoskeletal protein RodZ
VPKRGLLTVAWLVAGVLAVALATAAVSRVGNEVTGSRPSPLSAGEVQQELTAASTTTTTSSTTTAPPVSPPTTGGSTTTTLAAPATTASVAAPTETRTYALVGGTATLRFSPQGVTVVTATPNPGFSVDVEPEHGNGVKVEFESDAHESRVDGWWDGGPVERVSEGD